MAQQVRIKLTVRLSWWVKPVAIAGLALMRLFPTLADRVTSIIMLGVNIEVA